MNLNPKNLLKAKSAWSSFRSNHPNVLPFLKDVLQKGIKEDVQVEILVHYPDGTDKNLGLRLKQSDVEFFDVLQNTLLSPLRRTSEGSPVMNRDFPPVFYSALAAAALPCLLFCAFSSGQAGLPGGHGESASRPRP